MKLTQEEKLYLKLMSKSQLQVNHPEAKPKPKKISLLADMFSQAKEYGSGASKNLSETPVSKEAVKTFDKGAKISKIVAKDLGAKGKKLTKEARERIKNLDMFLDDFEKAQKISKKYREATKQTSQDFKDSANMEDEYEEWLKKNQKPDNTQKINVDVFVTAIFIPCYFFLSEYLSKRNKRKSLPTSISLKHCPILCSSALGSITCIIACP